MTTSRNCLAWAVAVLCAACQGRQAGSGTGKAGAEQAKSAPAVDAADPRAQIFLTKGCPQCHTISAWGVKSQTEVGPDLTLAYADVKARFGVTLEEFLPAPTGTMQMVLSQMITLTPAERDSIIHILKRLHQEREERGEHNP